MTAPDCIHAAALDAHAEARPDSPALVVADARRERYTFAGMADASRRVARLLREEDGLETGDRATVVLPQGADLPLLVTACSRLGAIACPVSPLFGPEGLAARLRDAQPRVVYTDATHAGVVREGVALSGLRTPVHAVGQARFAAWRRRAPLSRGEEAPSGPDGPAVLLYTSGAVGPPKGVVLPHRVLAGRMPGFLLAHEPFGEASVFHSPVDWSWIGGLFDALLAPWCAGACVVAQPRTARFDASAVWTLLRDEAVTDAFLPPTALNAMMRSLPAAKVALNAVHSAGEPLAPAVARWAREQVSPHVTEVYGLSEAAFLVGTASRAYATPEGHMGLPYPGQRVDLRHGEIVVGRGTPTLMMGYWQGAERPPMLPTDADGWFRTGDLAARNDAGFYRFLSRQDDLIKTAGYRVGPAEVEACLLLHPAVAECAVVGVPDAERGQSVKAFVKPAPGSEASPALADEIQRFVRSRLAAHAYPRQVEFVDALPLTATGKIRRRELRGTGGPR